ncbi:MAG: ABC transporter permease, partial [Firmicutes bacterium]|nr:ABC transporter permease [Bacillota bacterium]
MAKFSLVFKFLLKNSQILPKTKKEFLRLLLFGVCILPLVGLFCYSLVSLTKSCIVGGVLPELLVLTVSSVQAFLFFFIFRTFNAEFFDAKDNEFFIALPISPSCIYFARFLKFYLNELLFSTIVLTPFLWTIVITAITSGVTFGVGFYLTLIPIYVLTPLTPILIISSFSLPIAAIKSFFKQRGTLSSILSILLYLGAMVGYFFLIPKMDAMGEGLTLNAAAITAIKTAGKVFYFNRCQIFVATGIEVGKNFGIGFAIFIALAAIAFSMAVTVYKKGFSTKFESSAQSNLPVSFKGKSKVSALMSRDFKQIIRVPSMAINTFATAFIAPVLLAIMVFADFQNLLGSDVGTLGLASFLMMYAMMLTPGTNTSASLAFSREGKSFEFLKHLPISSNDILKSKILLSCIISVIATLLDMIIGFALYKVSAIETLFVGISVLSACVATNVSGMYIDSKRPNFVWNTVNEITKRSRSQFAMLLPFFVCAVYGILVFAFGVALDTLNAEKVIRGIETKIIFWAVVTVASVGISALVGF